MFKWWQGLRFWNENESVLTRVFAVGIQVFYCKFTSASQFQNKGTDSDVRQGTLHSKLYSLTSAGDMCLFRWQGWRFCNENLY